MNIVPFQNLPLWPAGKAPFAVAEDAENKEHYKDENTGIDILAEVSQPELSFFPASGSGPHPAVLVCPGGGYYILAYKHEGTDIAAWLNTIGISAFVLKYRCPHRREAARADVTRAMRIIRSRAEELGVLQDKIGIIGFSAGAHLSAVACNPPEDAPAYEPIDEIDSLNARPNFSFLIYPAYLFADGYEVAPELAVSEKTPPAFIIQAQDDAPLVDSSLAYFIALKRFKVPAELHVFPNGGHGYGLLRKGNPTDAWPALAAEWFANSVMKARKW